MFRPQIDTSQELRRPASRRAVMTLAVLVAALLTWLSIPRTAMGFVTQPKTPRPITTGFVDDALFLFTDVPATRNLWMQRARDMNAGVIRIDAAWGVFEPTEPDTPTDPSDPAYNFAHLDAAVEAADAMGLDVMLTAWRAPAWAEGPGRPASAPVGTWKPDAQAFGDYGQALATRYSGTYQGLPRVRYFEAWNEPNLTNFLTPQWQGGTPYSPTHYRQLLNEFYAGVHAGQPNAQVIGGATAPFGDDDPDHPQIPGSPRMQPMDFLRDMFCLNGSMQPMSCPAKPKLDILSAHPVNVITAPNAPASDPDDVKLADFTKLQRLLQAAEQTGHILPAGRHPLWATELWWITNPPNPIGVSLNTQAKYLEQGLYLLWKQGVRTAINWTIRDSEFDPSQPPQPQATTGMFLFSGTAKPAYTAWQFPFVADRRSRARIFIWGKAPATGTLNVQRLRSGSWQTVKRLAVQNGQVFTTTLPISGSADLRGTIGSMTSLTWHQD